MKVLSGVQSSGKLHLGNYLGAMKQHIELQSEHDCFYFIANYHALTSVQEADLQRQLTRDVALDYLALGLDPKRVRLFRQSDVPEVCELAWILSTVTGKGLMERAHSYKDKVARGLPVTMGLFSYPILMAADILVYRSDIVPVGKDQVQHIEMAQDMAAYFNNTYNCKVLVRPEPRLNEAPIVPGVDGEKMSKSYGNTIDLFDPPDVVEKRFRSIKTDSLGVDEPKQVDSLLILYRVLATPQEVEQLEAPYLAGGIGYGELKKRLAQVFERTFGPARERRVQLAADSDYVEDCLRDGAKRARVVAAETMQAVRQACGIITA